MEKLGKDYSLHLILENISRHGVRQRPDGAAKEVVMVTGIAVLIDRYMEN